MISQPTLLEFVTEEHSLLAILSSAMESTKFLSSTGVSCLLPYRNKSPKARNCKPFSVLSMAASGGSKGRDYQGRMVDENMIVLRMRIREKKLSEERHEPPSNWMEWEKKYYVHYNEDVYEAMGLLQTYLMNIRPGLAVGTVALISLSLLISTGVVFSQAVEIVKLILSGFH